MTHYHGGTDWQEGGGPEPTDHLPDCTAITTTHHKAAGLCICDRLRACEARLYTLMGEALQSAIEAEQERIVFIVKDYYRVAPKAAERLLELITETETPA